MPLQDQQISRCEADSMRLVNGLKRQMDAKALPSRKVIIVGGGFGGLFALKHCLARRRT